MSIPIKPNDENNKYSAMDFKVDYSFLAKSLPEKSSKKIVTASDSDAKTLMEIWEKAEKDGAYFKISSKIDVSYRDIMRLKTNGLLTGTNDRVQLTERAKQVIKTMVLGENNAFLKSQKQKSYTEIMASMDKRGKKGYRIADKENNETEEKRPEGKTPKFSSNGLIITTKPKE